MTILAAAVLALVMAYFGFMGWLLAQCIRADLELRKKPGYPWRGR